MLGEVGVGFSGSLFAGIALTTLGLWETPSGCAMRIGFLPAGGASPRATLARTIPPSACIVTQPSRWRNGGGVGLRLDGELRERVLKGSTGWRPCRKHPAEVACGFYAER